MQNTFSQSGNDSKWFLTKIIFQNRYVAFETPSRPPPFMANAILNFHFDFLNPSLSCLNSEWKATLNFGWQVPGGILELGLRSLGCLEGLTKAGITWRIETMGVYFDGSHCDGETP